MCPKLEEADVDGSSKTVGKEKALWSIRRLRPGDAEALAKFYNGLSETSRRTFRPLGWQTTAEACVKIVEGNQAGDKYDLIARLGSEVVGWSFVWDMGSGEPNFGLGVADAYQGQGLGAALMDRVLADVQAMGLERVYLIVVQDNHVASGLYERRGFVRYGELVGRDGLAYYQMVATFSDPGDLLHQTSTPTG